MDIDQIITTRYYDRKISNGAGQKRKQEEELSNNPHSKKARERVQGMTEIEK